MDESDSPDNKRKAHTICKVTESVAGTVLQFTRSRDGQYYNDSKAQPEGTHSKLSSRALGEEGAYKIFRAMYTFCNRANILVARLHTAA
jgi:hypothetical protein